MKTYDFDEILARRSPASQAAIESRYQELLSTFQMRDVVSVIDAIIAARGISESNPKRQA